MTQGPPPAENVRQFTVAADDDGIRLDRWFKRNLPQVGFATVSRWARTGQIRVDGKRAKPEDRLEAGQVLRVPPGGEDTKREPVRPRARPLSPEQIAEAKDMVIRETPTAIVLNIPGPATQAGARQPSMSRLLDAFVEDERTPAPGWSTGLTRTLGRAADRAHAGGCCEFLQAVCGRRARSIGRWWSACRSCPKA